MLPCAIVADERVMNDPERRFRRSTYKGSHLVRGDWESSPIGVTPAILDFLVRTTLSELYGEFLMSTAPLELQITPMPGPHPGPSPDKFFETITAYQHTAALKAAVELDLFTAIGDGQNTVSSLATSDAYTVSEDRAMLNSAGFSDFEVHSQAATPITAIVAAKP
jgi:hypothetical protein